MQPTEHGYYGTPASWWIGLALMLHLATVPGISGEETTHPLLPGLRSHAVLDPAWPEVFHDPLRTGFSPLRCQMVQKPRRMGSFQLPGNAAWVWVGEFPQSTPVILVQDSRLRRITLRGEVLWDLPHARALFCDQLWPSAPPTVGAVRGSELLLIDSASGEIYWHRRFPGSLGPAQVRVGRFIPGQPGKQLAVFPMHAHVGFLFVHRGPQDVHELWQTSEAKVNRWPEQADHGVSVLASPDGHFLCNVRHHTINIFDAATGKLLSRQEFSVAGARRRNYGPVVLGRADGGTHAVIILASRIELHVSVLGLSKSWQIRPLARRFLSYVYDEETYGTALHTTPRALGDLDGDGSPEALYSVRSVSPQPHSTLFLADTRSVESARLAELWLCGLADLDGDGQREVLAYDDPDGIMPEAGTLAVLKLERNGRLNIVGRQPGVRVVKLPVAPLDQPDDVAWLHLSLQAPAQSTRPPGIFVQETRTGKLRLLGLRDGELRMLPAPVRWTREKRLLAIWTDRRERNYYFVQQPDGTLDIESEQGQVRGSVRLRARKQPLLSAADLDGDQGHELIVADQEGRVHVYDWAGKGRYRRLWSAPFAASSARLGPQVVDLDGDGSREVLTFDRNEEGFPVVVARAADGTVRWRQTLPAVPSATVTRWVAARFFGRKHRGVFVAAERDHAWEGAFLLDGRDGHVVWRGPAFRTPEGYRRCRPLGIPTAWDIDGDGDEELILDYLDYVAVLDGRTGRALVGPVSTPAIPGRWKLAYNTFVPVVRRGEREAFFLVVLGHGGVGLLRPGFTRPVWLDTPYYDTPYKVGLVDVDGDGRLEVGYEEARNGWFVCRDAWSGRVRWRLKLPGAGYGACITADFDGDGRGEFFLGDCCIDVDQRGKPRILWRTGRLASAMPLVADVDGDGTGELILPLPDGTVEVLGTG